MSGRRVTVPKVLLRSAPRPGAIGRLGAALGTMAASLITAQYRALVRDQQAGAARGRQRQQQVADRAARRLVRQVARLRHRYPRLSDRGAIRVMLSHRRDWRTRTPQEQTRAIDSLTRKLSRARKTMDIG
jgi:hypothetical protein